MGQHHRRRRIRVGAAAKHNGAEPPRETARPHTLEVRTPRPTSNWTSPSAASGVATARLARAAMPAGIPLLPTSWTV